MSGFRRFELGMLFMLANAAYLSPAVAAAPATNTQPAADAQRVAELFIACSQGDRQSVEKIVRSPGASVVNAQLPSLATPLQRAVEFRQLEIAEYLLSQGAEPNLISGKDNDTPLLHAAYLGDARMVELLLKHGANPNQQESRFGHTPLTYAAWKGHVAVAKLLLQAGADPTIKNKQGQDARRIAATRHHDEIAREIDLAISGKHKHLQN